MADPLLVTFLEEAERHLAQAHAGLQGMERGMGMADAPAINTCYRSIHTVGGLAAYLRLERIVALAQGAERLLEEMRTNRLHRGASRIDALLRAIVRMLALVSAMRGEAPGPIAGEHDRISDHEIIRGLRAWTLVSGPGPRLAARCNQRSVPRYSQYGNQIPTGPPMRSATTKGLP